MTQQDYLAHHGVLGMKWGVRRYQNADGSLTNKGKRRYMTDANGNYVKINRRNLRNYDYKQGANYQNAKKGQKSQATKTFEKNAIWLGNTAAKRISARMDNGLTEKQAARGEFAKQFIAGTANSMLLTDALVFRGAGAKYVANSIGKTAKGVANKAAAAKASKAARDATIKITEKQLKKVAKNVYKYV